MAEQQLLEGLERLNTIFIGRELRMMELKKEIDGLCLKPGLPARYGTSPGG